MEKLFFEYILPLSAVGAAVTVFMLAAEYTVGRYLRKSTLCAMWRLVVPFYFVPVGVLWPAKAAAVSKLPPLEWPEPLLNAAQGIGGTAAAAGSEPLLSKLLVTIWLVGTFLYAAHQVTTLMGFSRLTKTNSVPCEPWEEEVLASLPAQKGFDSISLRRMDGIGSPMLFGLIRPVILLPLGEMSEERLRLVLSHEAAHFERGDLWHKRVMLILTAIYWFSPFSHFLMRHTGRLCESACDERVAESLNGDMRREYAMAILDSLDAGRVPQSFSTTFSSGAYQMKRRLEYIMNIPQNTISRRLVSLSLAAALIICGVLMSSACTAKAVSPERIAITAAPEKGEDESGSEVTAVVIGGDGQKEFSFALPVSESHYVSLGYGSYGHEGVDFVSEDNGSIYAAKGGTVVKAENDTAYGNYVIIDHGEGMQTLYAHCSELLVSEGDEVEAGAEIAKIGSTGNSTGPHLHFEFRVDGESQDPTEMLSDVSAS